MPMRDEFIERAVRQLAVALAKLTGLERASAAESTEPLGRAELAALRSQVEGLYPAFLGTSSALVDLLGIEDLLGVIGSAGYVDGERAYLLSALLETEAELLRAEADLAESAAPAATDAVAARAARLKERALMLVLEAGGVGLGEADIRERARRLAADLNSERLGGAYWERVHHFEFALHDYAAAENALFEWLELAPEAHERVKLQGEAFYRELERLEDAELEAGGLPRAELAEGRADLMTRLSQA